MLLYVGSKACISTLRKSKVRFFDPQTTWRGKKEMYFITGPLEGWQPIKNWCLLGPVHCLKSLVCQRWKKNPPVKLPRCKWQKSLIMKIPAHKKKYMESLSLARNWHRTQACGNRAHETLPLLAPDTHAIEPMTSVHWSDATTTEVPGDLGRAFQFMIDKSTAY